MHLLLKLGKASLATQLFLSQRSAILRFAMKQQLLNEGSALPFISKLCRSFVNHLIDTCRDFETAFRMTPSHLHPSSSGTGAGGSRRGTGASSSQPNSLTLDSGTLQEDSSIGGVASLMSNGGVGESSGGTGGAMRSPGSAFPPSFATACLVVWCQKEILSFISLFSRHVFSSAAVPIGVLCESVSVLRNEVNRIRNLVGLDFLFYVDKLVRDEVVAVIEEARKKLTDQLKAKFREEDWQAVCLKSAAGLSKFLDSDVKEPALKAAILESGYVFDDHKLSLSPSTVFFARSIVSLTTDFMKLSTPFTHVHVVRALLQTIQLFMDHIDACLRSDGLRKEARFIRRNAAFLLETVFPLVDSAYASKTGHRFRELEAICLDYEYLRDESGAGKPVRKEPEAGGGANGGVDPRRGSKSTITVSQNNHRQSSGAAGTSSPADKRRSPSKSTVSITDGKITSTITYL